MVLRMVEAAAGGNVAMADGEEGDLVKYGSGHPQRRGCAGIKGTGSDTLVI